MTFNITEEEPFLRTLLDAPSDTFTRAVYADWLEERGDIRAEYLRIEIEERIFEAAPEVRKEHPRLEKFSASLDPLWSGFMTTLACPVRPEAQLSNVLRFRSESIFPVTEPIVGRGKLFSFESQFQSRECWDDDLLEDVRVLHSLQPCDCTYGSGGYPTFPFLCTIDAESLPLTGAGVLVSLKQKHFSNHSISSLNTTSLEHTGYHPGLHYDEIHNEFTNQYLFTREVDDGIEEPDSDSEECEWLWNHGKLKSHVLDGQLWYVLLHETHGGDYPWAVLLFGVGLSPSKKRLVGIVTAQNCHNLCD